MRELDACCAEMQRRFWDVSLDLLIAQARQVDRAVMRLMGVKADDAESPYFIWRGGTCRTCAPRTGNIYRRGVDEEPPAHPNCRCYAEPYWGEVPTNEDGKPLTGLPSRILERPEGVPENWIRSISKNEKGVRYRDPNNMHNEVRVQHGRPESSNPGQQRDYVRWKRNGQWLDKDGNPVSGRSLESHIPIEDFKFDPRIFR